MEFKTSILISLTGSIHMIPPIFKTVQKKIGKAVVVPTESRAMLPSPSTESDKEASWNWLLSSKAQHLTPVPCVSGFLMAWPILFLPVFLPWLFWEASWASGREAYVLPSGDGSHPAFSRAGSLCVSCGQPWFKARLGLEKGKSMLCYVPLSLLLRPCQLVLGQLPHSLVRLRKGTQTRLVSLWC